MRAHVLQHASFEDIGSIAAWLAGRRASIGYTRFHEAAAVLPNLSAVDLLVVMGGPMSVNDEQALPWLGGEKRFIREAIERGIPVLGVCLGAQLIASALGCRVYANRVKEIGWFPVVSTPGAAVLGFPPTATVFHWHGDTFDLPDGAVRLATSAACENQAFRLNDGVIGLQFHLEATPDGVRALVEHCAHELTPGPCVQSAARMCAVATEAYAEANQLMERVLSFLAPARRTSIEP